MIVFPQHLIQFCHLHNMYACNVLLTDLLSTYAYVPANGSSMHYCCLIHGILFSVGGEATHILVSLTL